MPTSRCLQVDSGHPSVIAKPAYVALVAAGAVALPDSVCTVIEDWGEPF